MKLMVASDIHGSSHFCEKLMAAFHKENPEKLVLLGDLLYHGPRNALPEEYAPQKVCAMLNGIKEKLLCVRGNCEAEVDQMLLDFPVLADYALLFFGGKAVFLTHGHLFSDTHLPPLEKGSVLLCGHTHVPCIKEVEGIWYVNPGSVSIPKENSPHGYLILEGSDAVWKDLDGIEWQRHSLF